ncbi:TetR/AcrR family transcriptional regulator [Novispirillum itersonii]|uniref:AcrR family transcriptional regulator n=1 Tax=Novispirillum itersonii TaxID=189 RepID=A0A7X0DN99_NOVIT|nr:TetR/AcrR family transcriptional regulator [Novispirillum itersonii]MBB6210017.1 AcrR family transcriptional regulator [Novispirillum itersonii]
MTDTTDRRSRKRQATRQAISNAATRLFWERGFDAVTIDEIAAAADVGRMTVFNHFPRKEDLFFDREAEGRELLRTTALHREKGVSPLEAFRRLAHRLIAEQAPYVVFSAESQAFIRTVEESPTLKARARAIRDELAAEIASALIDATGAQGADPHARLAASLLLAAWTTAFIEAHRTYQQTQSAEAAQAQFLHLIDRAGQGIAVALQGTAYA